LSELLQQIDAWVMPSSFIQYHSQLQLWVKPGPPKVHFWKFVETGH